MGKWIVCAIWLLTVATAEAATTVGPVTGATIGGRPPVKPVPDVKPVSYRPITRPTGAPVGNAELESQDVQTKALVSSTAGSASDNSETMSDHAESDTTPGSSTGTESSSKKSAAESTASDDDHDEITSTTTSEDKAVAESSDDDSDNNAKAADVAQSAASSARPMSSQSGFVTISAVLVSAIAAFLW